MTESGTVENLAVMSSTSESHKLLAAGAINRTTHCMAYETSVAIIFSGVVRGDARLWANIKRRLVEPNAADVFAAFWEAPTAVGCFKEALGASVIRVVEVTPLRSDDIAQRVGLSNSTLRERRLPDGFLPQYFVLSKAFELVASTGHAVLVRARIYFPV